MTAACNNAAGETTPISSRLRIGVVIPVYNGEAFIRESLESLYSQTRPPDEVIVADDASTDRTREIVAEIARHAPVPTRLLVMPENTGGPYTPAARAFETTDCDLFAVLDADDLFEQEAFETYHAEFAPDVEKRIGLVTTPFRTFDEKGLRETSSLEERSPEGNPLRDGEDSRTLSNREATELQCCDFSLPFKGMVRREAWEAVGGPDLSLKHACDCDFTWRLARHTDYSIRMLRQPLMRVRLSHTSMSHNRFREAYELVRVFRNMARDTRGSFEGHGRVLSRLNRELKDLAYESRKSGKMICFLRASLSLLSLRFRT